jgi:hypothetical protein
MHVLQRFCLTLLGCLALTACGVTSPSPQSPEYVDAVELKLKFRELADQMLATVPNDALNGLVAMPTSFVDQNDSTRSCPLGRLAAETLFYEFNQRGFPAREYRLTGSILVTGGKDDIALAASRTVPTTGQKWAALVVGTYYVEKDATFVNARLVRASDGLVLRTGQLVLANTPVVARMTREERPKVVVAAKPAEPAASTVAEKRAKASLYTPIKTLGTSSLPIRQGR